MNKLKISPLTMKSGSNDDQQKIETLQLELKIKDALLKGFHTDNERLEQQVDKLTEDKKLLSLKYEETLNKLKALDDEYQSLRRKLEENKRLQPLLEKEYKNEKAAWDKQEEVQMKYVQLQQSINQYMEQIQTLKQDKIEAITYYEAELSSLDNELQRQKESFKHQINIYENQVNFKNSIIDDLSSRLELLIQDNEKMSAFLFEEVNTGLNISDQLLMEVSKLEKEYQQLERKYNALSNSRLGKLTLKYWQLKKRRARRE